MMNISSLPDQYTPISTKKYSFRSIDQLRSRRQEGVVGAVGAATIKVPECLVIPKECRRWHKQTYRQTLITTDIATFRLINSDKYENFVAKVIY